jgi:hypothetical protein
MRFLAGISTCAAALTPLAAAFIALPSVPEVALSDASGSDASLHAAPLLPACGWDDIVAHPSDPSAPSASEAPCGETSSDETPKTLAEIAEARAYLVETASPGYTMTLQGPEVAIGRLHPEFAVRLEHAIREARSAGLPSASVFSAYRPPAFGVGGFSNKFNSLHTYGLAVDMRGIGEPGSAEAELWHRIAAKNGVVCPYGPRDRAEWNHCQPTSVKMIVAQNPLRETVSSAGPNDLDSMFEAGNAMIVDMASAADSLSRAAPTPVHALEAPAKSVDAVARVAVSPRTKRSSRTALARGADKPEHNAKAVRVAAESASPAKTERIAAKSRPHPKAEQVATKSTERERLAAKSAEHAKSGRVAAKSAEHAKSERVAAKSAEHAKSERVAAKSQDAKPAQRKGRSAGAEESHQKAKSRGA